MCHYSKMPSGGRLYHIGFLLLLIAFAILTFGVWFERRARGLLEGFEARRSDSVVTFSTGLINCVGRSVGTNNVKQYLCETEADATRLMNGPSDATKAYLGPTDFVCIKSPETNPAQYYCKDLDLPDDAEDVRYGMMDNYQTACDNLNKTYLDLSNNLTNLVNMKDTVNFTTTSLGNFSKSLSDLKGTLKCSLYTPPPPEPSPLAVYGAVCARIDDVIKTLNDNRTVTNELLGRILEPVTNALNLRDQALKNRTDFRCPT